MSHAVSTTALDHPAYHMKSRIGGKSYSAITALTSTDGLKLIKRFMPQVSGVEHLTLARKHLEQSRSHERQWKSAAEAYAQKQFGRSFPLSDYMAAECSVDAGLPSDDKASLDTLSFEAGKHLRLAMFHFMAAGQSHAAALSFARSPI